MTSAASKPPWPRLYTGVSHHQAECSPGPRIGARDINDVARGWHLTEGKTKENRRQREKQRKGEEVRPASACRAPRQRRTVTLRTTFLWEEIREELLSELILFWFIIFSIYRSKKDFKLEVIIFLSIKT